MKVRRLPVDPGPAAWNRLLPEADPPTVLDAELTADWLVIGAGFAGLSAAHRLAELHGGDRIVVLDATRIGEGPAGRNSGFMIDLPHDLASADYTGAAAENRTEIDDNRRGIAFAGAMAATYGLSDEAFALTGKINAAATPKGLAHNRSFAAHLAGLNEAHRMLDAAEMADLTGTRYYLGGLFTPGTAMIQPAMFVRAVAAGLVSNRVSIFENSPVTALERNGDWVATTPGGRVAAPRVILAVNGHLASFGIMSDRLVHVFTFASMTRALNGPEVAALGGSQMWGVTPADPMGTTVRRICGAGGDRIVVRNRFTVEPKMEVDPAQIAHAARGHDRAFAARFPMLDGMDIEYRWGGRLCLSRNNVQVIGEVKPGLFAACCQNGLGTAKGTLAGLLAAELASGVSSPALDRALASPEPIRVPPGFITKPVGNARTRWGEVRAGKEL
ncbi:MAG: FAD-binding oxidoreductase [Pseudomonadota bacterium]